MIFNKKTIIIIIAVIVVVAGSTAYMVIDTRDPKVELQKLYVELKSAKTLEETLKIEKKIIKLKKKLGVEDSLNRGFEGMKNIEKKSKLGKTEITSTR